MGNFSLVYTPLSLSLSLHLVLDIHELQFIHVKTILHPMKIHNWLKSGDRVNRT